MMEFRLQQKFREAGWSTSLLCGVQLLSGVPQSWEFTTNMPWGTVLAAEKLQKQAASQRCPDTIRMQENN
jgi:hypothetical protein